MVVEEAASLVAWTGGCRSSAAVDVGCTVSLRAAGSCCIAGSEAGRSTADALEATWYRTGSGCIDSQMAAVVIDESRGMALVTIRPRRSAGIAA